MMRLVPYLTVVLLATGATGNAATFLFNTDPFAGSTAPTTPGRQVVGGEPSITFNPATDVFRLDFDVFGVDDLRFLSDVAANVPASGINTVVLQNTDVPFAAGIAASLIADQVTDPGPGFFIYFNSGLDLPRLVFSADLSDPDADLKVLARMVNLGGAAGRAELANFTAANFAPVPEPSSLLLTSGALLICGWAMRRRQKVS
jgi:hypothetical protein